MEREDISILSLDSTTAGSMTAQPDDLLVTTYDTNSLLSPDDEDLTWSKEVIEEVERKMKNIRVVAPVKRGRSLEQLLQVCQLDDDSKYPLYSRSVSMPKLQSCSGLHAGQHLTGCEDVGPSSEVEPTILTNGDIVSAEGVVNGSFKDGEDVLCQHNIIETDGTDEWGSPPSNNDQAESYQLTTNCRPGENSLTVDEHRGNSHSNGGRHPEDRASYISLSTPHARKRFTASDELHVLQLQLARDEVSKKPSAMLSQYQVLSLEYSLRFNSRPYVWMVLQNCQPQSEAHLYRLSYKLEV